MNVMFVAIYPIVPSVGGVQRVTDVLAKELQSRGHTVIFVTYSRKHLMSYANFSAPQYYVEINERSSDDIKNEIDEIILKHKIEVVISQNFCNVHFLRFLPKRVKIVSVCHVQPFLGDSIKRNQLLNMKAKGYRALLRKWLYLLSPSFQQMFNSNEIKLYKETFEISNMVCFISSRFFHRVLKHLPQIDKSKLCAIANPNTFSNSISISPNEKENIILWVGRVENSGKNTIGFIKAWQRITNMFPEWKAIVIGEGEDLKYNVEYVNQHKICNIEFLGRIDNVESWYKKAKYVVITSWSESWCMAITEGMEFGCVPIVYNTYETISDLITDKETGFKVEPNVKDLARTLEFAFRNDALRYRMSKNAMSTVRKYDVSKIASQWEQLLMNACYGKNL